MPFLRGQFVTPDAYPEALASEPVPKVSDIESISPELIAQIYAEGFQAGFMSVLEERAKLDAEKSLQQRFASVPAN